MVENKDEYKVHTMGSAQWKELSSLFRESFCHVSIDLTATWFDGIALNVGLQSRLDKQLKTWLTNASSCCWLEDLLQDLAAVIGRFCFQFPNSCTADLDRIQT